MARAADASTVSGLAKSALSKMDIWCREVRRSVNPEKTGIVIFARRRKLDVWRNPRFQGRHLGREEVVKHLAVILDAELDWRP